MLPFDEALKIVLDSARKLGSESVEIAHVTNRILAEDVESDMDMPPRDRSVFDGYACRRQDLANELKIIETIPAGMPPKKTIGPNQCAKIMTGATVPKGADCVFMVELSENPTAGTVRFTGEDTDDNIRPKGRDIKTGQVVLRCGTRIRPQDIAVLATVGHAEVMVSRKPMVGIIATGDELVEPHSKPSPWRLRNSNSPQLVAQLEGVGAVVTDYGISKDTTGDIVEIFRKAAAENDVVLVSGGVSMGDFDLVPEILKNNNVELLFEKIALKPGKPTVFGISEDLYCFGLPGNPVSTFVVFELLVKPFLYKLMEHDYKAPNIRMPLGETISRKDTERRGWIPIEITDAGTLKKVEYHDSGHINALCGADGLVCMDIGVAEIPEGTIVQVRLI
ncbi:MAG: molybdopterin molybdotransferase MoeA [Sedimentisphaerales bacterium]|nr:molybdopterin molybdotransferase MoeA [Sedimentisphaerales bacterium]